MLVASALRLRLVRAFLASCSLLVNSTAAQAISIILVLKRIHIYEIYHSVKLSILYSAIVYTASQR